MLNITLYVEQEGEERYQIGTVTPLVCDEASIHDLLDRLWGEWREADPNPDADSFFVDWLVEEKGWEEVDTNDQHTFRT